MELSLPFLSCLSILAAYLSDKELLQFCKTNKMVYTLLKKEMSSRLRMKIYSLLPEDDSINTIKLGNLFKQETGMGFFLATGKSVLTYVTEHQDLFDVQRQIQNKNQKGKEINAGYIIKVVRRDQPEDISSCKKRKFDNEECENGNSHKKGKIEKAKLTVVLDTNCLIHRLNECEHIHKFIKERNGQLTIPNAVFRELDGLKKSSNDRTQQQARKALKFLAENVNTYDLKAEIAPRYTFQISNDCKIVECAFQLHTDSENDTYLVSNDNGVIYLAKSRGVKSMTVREFGRLMKMGFS